MPLGGRRWPLAASYYTIAAQRQDCHWEAGDGRLAASYYTLAARRQDCRWQADDGCRQLAITPLPPGGRIAAGRQAMAAGS